jgi:transposase InsO family protein
MNEQRHDYAVTLMCPSMSWRANCWDNAVAKPFFSSMKKERIQKRIYKTRDLARADIFDYIEVFYNRTRRHSHIGRRQSRDVQNRRGVRLGNVYQTRAIQTSSGLR